MKTQNGYLRQISRGWIKIGDRHYWHKDLDKYDGKTVMVVPINEQQTAQIFYNGLLICNSACIELSEGQEARQI